MKIEEALQIRVGRRLVFTNGVFDILHAGHVRYLREAAALGDLLIVGVNSDDSVRRLNKGPNRPINSLDDRIFVLEGLACVAGAVEFGEDTPIKIIKRLRPEIHAKGGDYDPESMPETPFVRAYGGVVCILPLLEGRSTTRTLRKLGVE